VTNYSKASEKYKEEKAYDVDFGLLKSQEKNYLPNKISQQFESSQPIYTQVQQQQPKEGMYTQQQAFALPQTSCFPQQIQQQTYPQQQLQQACPPSQPQQLYPQQQQTLAQPQVQQVYLQQQQPLIQPQMQQVYPQQTCVPQSKLLNENYLIRFNINNQIKSIKSLSTTATSLHANASASSLLSWPAAATAAILHATNATAEQLL